MVGEILVWRLQQTYIKSVQQYMVYSAKCLPVVANAMRFQAEKNNIWIKCRLKQQMGLGQQYLEGLSLTKMA